MLSAAPALSVSPTTPCLRARSIRPRPVTRCAASSSFAITSSRMFVPGSMFGRLHNSAYRIVYGRRPARPKRAPADDLDALPGRFVVSAASSGGAMDYGSSSDNKKIQLLEKQLAAEKDKVRKLQGGAGSSFNGVFLILLLNVGLFVADHLLHLPLQFLYLNHARPHWFQFLTSSFCHANWGHLSSNLFFLYIFGKLVEEEEGFGGLLATYAITGVGASLASYLLLPKMAGVGMATVSLGASGAVFGLFAVSVLVKMSFSLRKLLEMGILGQFVWERLINEVGMQAGEGKVMGGLAVNHIAHLAGALVGVLLIFLLSRISEPGDGVKKLNQ
mmetsp:Transcript_33191/g.105816  ORF Transcript_33191/g.105816 Transcript_33191/m.105816 type:complete len:331 (+) Transcript_33191:21-1013(+)